MGLIITDHPLIQNKISIMRDKNTNVKEFRKLTCEVATLICYEATRNLKLYKTEIETPVAKANVNRISGKELAFIPILRAGLGMLEGVSEMIPTAAIGHMGFARNSEHNAEKYYCNLPKDIAEREVILLDPMLATGSTAVQAVTELKEMGVKNIKFLCIVAAPEGIDVLLNAHPDIDIYCGAKDEGLNDDKYIVPGLGDAGDRIFGTL